MRPTPSWWLYGGLAALVAGFAVLAFTWARVAGSTSVPLQVPYVISGGGTAVVLVLTGMRLLDIDATLRDAARQDRQLDELRGLLDEMYELLGGEHGVGRR